MVVVPIIMFVLAAVLCVIACVWFAQNTRDSPSDMMGASMSFDGPWWVASASFGCGIALLAGDRWWHGVVAFLICFVGGWFFKWLVLEKLLEKWRR